MSRFTSFLHRIFGGAKHIIEDISINVVGPALYEITVQKAKTDEARREIVQKVVKEYIGKRWPAYAWLTDRAVDIVFATVREQLARRKK
jgi:hypothetical protein